MAVTVNISATMYVARPINTMVSAIKLPPPAQNKKPPKRTTPKAQNPTQTNGKNSNTHQNSALFDLNLKSFHLVKKDLTDFIKLTLSFFLGKSYAQMFSYPHCLCRIYFRELNCFFHYSTVTDLAKLRGLSMSVPLIAAVW